MRSGYHCGFRSQTAWAQILATHIKAVSPSMSYLASLHLSFLLEDVNNDSTCLAGLV